VADQLPMLRVNLRNPDVNRCRLVGIDKLRTSMKSHGALKP
jgi:hypothetical protein